MGKFMDMYNKIREEELNRRKLMEQGEDKPDTRYMKPKSQPKVSEELIDEVIEETEIYRKAKEHILKAQRTQVAYGIEKYPEPLNANTWSIIETIDHAIDESVDKLHYLVMLRIKLEREMEANRCKRLEDIKRDDGLDAQMYTMRAMKEHKVGDPDISIIGKGLTFADDGVYSSEPVGGDSVGIMLRGEGILPNE